METNKAEPCGYVMRSIYNYKHFPLSSSSSAGRLSSAALRSLQVLPHQRQHRTSKGSTGGGGCIYRAPGANDGLFKHLS